MTQINSQTNLGYETLNPEAHEVKPSKCLMSLIGCIFLDENRSSKNTEQKTQSKLLKGITSLLDVINDAMKP